MYTHGPWAFAPAFCVAGGVCGGFHRYDAGKGGGRPAQLQLQEGLRLQSKLCWPLPSRCCMTVGGSYAAGLAAPLWGYSAAPCAPKQPSVGYMSCAWQRRRSLQLMTAPGSVAMLHETAANGCRPRVAMTPHTFLSPRSAQDEFRFFMDDAGSKLLVLPTRGNAAAEGAAAELGTPTATFSVTTSEGASPALCVAMGFDADTSLARRCHCLHCCVAVMRHRAVKTVTLTCVGREFGHAHREDLNGTCTTVRPAWVCIS